MLQTQTFSGVLLCVSFSFPFDLVQLSAYINELFLHSPSEFVYGAENVVVFVLFLCTSFSSKKN
eukprot:UN11483